MQHTWEHDAPNGVYKNHAMSEKLRYAAIANSEFMQFARPESGYGKKNGESVTITRISNLDDTHDGRISEGQPIPEDELSLSTVAITVSEFGRAVPFTSLSTDLSEFNIDNIVQRKLRDQMSIILDTAASSAFASAKVKAIPTGVAALTFDTDGTPSSQATANVNVYHIEQIRDYMFSTLKVPMIDGSYVGIVSTKFKRGIMNDPKWEKFHQYGSPEMKFKGEIGRMEGIRFIETNNLNAVSQSLGSGGVLGEGFIFGEDAIAMAVSIDPELRAKVATDYGRSQGVAWYGVLDFGIIWDTANAGEARIVHVTSS